MIGAAVAAGYLVAGGLFVWICEAPGGLVERDTGEPVRLTPAGRWMTFAAWPVFAAWWLVNTLRFR